MSCGPLFLPVTLADIEDLAVAITRYGQNHHAALIYRDSNDSLKLLELGMEGRVENREPSEEFAWAVPQIDPILRRNAAALCEVVAAKNQTVYYSFHYPMPAEFSIVSGDLTLGAGAIGLTCATFVLAMLHSVQIELLALATWQHRVEDHLWQRWLHGYMQHNRLTLGIPQYILDQNQANLPCLRYRPEEVLAGAIDSHSPIDFARAEAQGSLVRSWIGAFIAIYTRRGAFGP